MLLLYLRNIYFDDIMICHFCKMQNDIMSIIITLKDLLNM